MKIFVRDFGKDEDGEFEEFKYVDEMIKQIGEQYEEASVYLLDQQRIKQVRYAATLMAQALRSAGNEVSFECRQHEAVPGAAVIHIEGEEIIFTDIGRLAEAAKLASNVEVYPLKSNKIRMTFMFYGIAKPVM